jgi:septum formation protein
MIVLASKSASRQAMLSAAGIAFEAIPAHIDERAVEAGLAGEPPEEVARVLAVEKALAISTAGEDRWVLGSDSLVVVDGRRFDKPRSREEAAEHLRFFSGRKMHLHSAAALVRHGHLKADCGDKAVLHVRELSEDFIARYLDAEWPAVAGCVGVFRIEGPGVQLFDSIEGDYFSILGMPLFNVLRALRQFCEPSE